MGDFPIGSPRKVGRIGIHVACDAIYSIGKRAAIRRQRAEIGHAGTPLNEDVKPSVCQTKPDMRDSDVTVGLGWLSSFCPVALQGTVVESRGTVNGTSVRIVKRIELTRSPVDNSVVYISLSPQSQDRSVRFRRSTGLDSRAIVYVCMVTREDPEFLAARA